MTITIYSIIFIAMTDMTNETNANDAALVWSEKGKRVILPTRVVTVTERDCVSFDGQEGKYIVLDAPDWVIVIPEVITESGEKHFLMVKQWRHGEKALSIEFPGGVAEAGERPEDAAARELKEETGAVAKRLIKLGMFNPNPAIMSNHVHIFLARDLLRTGEQSLDADERLAYLEMTADEVYSLTGCPACPHAIMASALALYLIHNN